MKLKNNIKYFYINNFEVTECYFLCKNNGYAYFKAFYRYVPHCGYLEIEYTSFSIKLDNLKRNIFTSKRSAYEELLVIRELQLKIKIKEIDFIKNEIKKLSS